MDTGHRLRRALLAGVRPSSHTQGAERRTGFMFGGKVKRTETDARTALFTHRLYGPAIVVGKEQNNVFVSCRGRVTKSCSRMSPSGKRSRANALG